VIDGARVSVDSVQSRRVVPRVLDPRGGFDLWELCETDLFPLSATRVSLSEMYGAGDPASINEENPC